MYRVGNIARLFILGAVFGICMGLSIGTPSAMAQVSVSTGSVSGTVLDPQGGTVPSARVTISTKDTGKSVSLETNGDGYFTSGGLAPGNYTVRVEAKSFKTYQTSVAVQVGQIA